MQKSKDSEVQEIEFKSTLIQIDMMGNVIPLTSSSDTGYMSYVCMLECMEKYRWSTAKSGSYFPNILTYLPSITPIQSEIHTS